MPRRPSGPMAEMQFAALVDATVVDAKRHEELLDLLREEHAVYRDRSAATISRMRGWVLLALERVGVSDRALAFVLEELDVGTDPYLVAAAARALRSYSRPGPSLVSFVLGALANIRYRDEPLSLTAYGAYAASATGNSAVHELLDTLAWLGPHATSAVPQLEVLLGPGGLPTKLQGHLRRALQAIREADAAPKEVSALSCCGAQAPSLKVPDSGARILLEDHAGKKISFEDFFHGRPSIVVFFYTRCDNPLKCSLTIAKLARVQQLLEEEGVADRIRTAAITYDPAFDLAPRLRAYGQDRGVRMDAGHRLFRALAGNDALRGHFGLGVNYVGSVVNRHRIELHVLDREARIVASFERLRWKEGDVVAKAVEVLKTVDFDS